MYTRKRICPRCKYKGPLSDFSPLIKISYDNFRIFHFYNQMKGPLYCNQCKRKYLLKIADLKGLTVEEKEFLKNEIKKNKKKFSMKLSKHIYFKSFYKSH